MQSNSYTDMFSKPFCAFAGIEERGKAKSWFHCWMSIWGQAEGQLKSEWIQQRDEEIYLVKLIIFYHQASFVELKLMLVLGRARKLKHVFMPQLR